MAKFYADPLEWRPFEPGHIAAVTSTEWQVLNCANRLDSRNSLDLLQQLPVEGCDLTVLGILEFGKSYTECQKVLCPKARISRLQAPETPDQQSRPDEQRHRQRHFRHHQKALSATPAAAPGRLETAFFQRFIQIYLGGLERGNQTKKQTGRHTGSKCEE